jgi:acylphosphatase
MLVARRFKVSGRVQGVGFRFFVYETALIEGVSGWVANLADGRVDVLVEGDAEAVERVERKLRRGPPAARVEAVDIVNAAPSERYTGFEIRQTGPEQ